MVPAVMELFINLKKKIPIEWCLRSIIPWRGEIDLEVITIHFVDRVVIGTE